MALYRVLGKGKKTLGLSSVYVFMYDIKIRLWDYARNNKLRGYICNIYSPLAKKRKQKKLLRKGCLVSLPLCSFCKTIDFGFNNIFTLVFCFVRFFS